MNWFKRYWKKQKHRRLVKDLWIKQGRPIDFPVVLSVGTIIFKECGGVEVYNWNFDISYVDDPFIIDPNFVYGLAVRYPQSVIHKA